LLSVPSEALICNNTTQQQNTHGTAKVAATLSNSLCLYFRKRQLPKLPKTSNPAVYWSFCYDRWSQRTGCMWVSSYLQQGFANEEWGWLYIWGRIGGMWSGSCVQANRWENPSPSFI